MPDNVATRSSRRRGGEVASARQSTPATERGGPGLRVTHVRALRGPNYWSLSPVVACDFQPGGLQTTSPNELAACRERLLRHLPPLRERLAREANTNGNAEVASVDAQLARMLMHAALELQIQAGCSASPGRVVRSGSPGTWWVAIGYDEAEVGIAVMREAARLLRSCLDDAPVDLAALVSAFRDLHDEVRLGPSTAALVEEAKRRGIPVRRLDAASRVQLGTGRHLRRIQATMSDNTSAIAVDIAQDKQETRRILRDAGVPVVEGEIAESLEEVRAAVLRLGYPVIIKPLDANHGRGVSPPIEDEKLLAGAWRRAAVHAARVVVERYKGGCDYRVLVIGGRMVACAERVPAHVIGDGIHTVEQLIAIANEDPRRGVGHHRMLTRIPLDDSTSEFLASRGLSADSVPASGETIQLRATANLSTGGTSIDRTEEIHPHNAAACEMAAGAVGLDIAGIDVLSPDISIPFGQNGGAVLEVNAAPGIRMHIDPQAGTPRKVAAPIIDLLFPPGSRSTIPIIAVTGTNGKTTTVRLIAHLLRSTQQTVGFSTTDGVHVRNRLVSEGDLTGPFGAGIILSNPTVDIAVLETARGGLLRSGLGFDECDAGVILNVRGDHLGVDGIDDSSRLAELKGVVAAVVRRDGHAVLNADDPLVYAMRERTSAEIVLFSAQDCGENELLESHTRKGGLAACMMGGQFVIRRGRSRIPIAAEREVPLMLGGAARFQRQNILAAALTVHARGMRYDDIRAALLSFYPSPALMPGRVNVIRLSSGARVLVDYAHNPHAIEGLVDLAMRLPARRRIAVIGMPGDRRDVDLKEGGRLCARFDHVLIKEDEDLRGRARNETAELLREGLRNGGLAEGAIEIVRSEIEATARGLALLSDDDILIVLAAKVREVLALVCELAAPGG